MKSYVTLEPKQPNCEEMIDYLINSQGYAQKTTEEIKADKVFEIIASACNEPLEAVIAKTLQRLKKE